MQENSGNQNALFVRDERTAQALKALGIDPAEATTGDIAHEP
jgi:hypothetical protein